MKLSIIYLWICIITLFFILLFLKPFYSASTIEQFKRVENQSKIPTSSQKIDEINYLKVLRMDSLNVDLESHIDIFNIKLISKITDSLVNQNISDELKYLQYFSTLLNEENSFFTLNSFDESTLDTLYNIFAWASHFKTLSLINSGYKKQFYEVVYDYWMTKIVRICESIAINNPNIGYTVKFKALKALCESSNYNVSLKTSNIDKVLYNVENSRFNYLVGRFYLIFGNFGLILLITLIIITIFSYISLFFNIKTYFKNAKL